MAEKSAEPTTSNPEQVVSPIGACISCRKAKVKCVVESEPPCNRCRKSSRQCEFPLARGSGHPRAQLRERQEAGGHEPLGERDAGTFKPLASGNHTPRVLNGNGASLQAYFSPYSIPLHSEQRPIDLGRSPSVHHVSAVPPVATPPAAMNSASSVSNNKYIVESNQQILKRRRTGTYSLDTNEGRDELPSEQDMEQLFEIFQEKLLRFIPIFGPEEFEDFTTLLVDQKPLVQCVCYVTARFLPGGNIIRDKLSKTISNLLLGASTIEAATASQSLAILQGFIVLYAYAQIIPGAQGGQSQPQHLLYWRVKTFTEAHAIQLFIHRSVEGLRAAVASHDSNISSSYCYKMYTYWLWLYTMSHYGSLATRTPPSIRADASIRAASKLLHQIGMSPRVSRLLGEVELCLSWEQASIKETELGEWWCQPESKVFNTPPRSDSLNDFQAALNRWSQRWITKIASDHPRNSLDLKLFHVRFVQFCISTYSIRPLKPPTTDHLLPAQKEAIANCVESASQVLVWALDLGPVSKDRLRYFCDFGFVMLSFSAFFILQVFQAFGSDIPQGDGYLRIVRDTAQLMEELAIDPKHAPAVYGSSILVLLEKVTHPEPGDSQLDSHSLSQSSSVSKSMNWMMSDSQAAADDQSSIPEQAWDFTSLFPDMLWN